MKCPWCGAENEDEARHCRICGNIIRQSTKEDKAKEAERTRDRIKKKDRSRRIREDRITVILGIILAAAVVVGGIGAFYGISRVMEAQQTNSTASGQLSDEMVEELNRTGQVSEGAGNAAEPSQTQQIAETQPVEEAPVQTAEPYQDPSAVVTETPAPVQTEEVSPFVTATVAYTSDITTAGCVQIPIIYAEATSVLTQDDLNNDASMACDGNSSTSWQEGVRGNGEGQSIALVFSQQANVKFINCRLGNWRNEDYYEENSRPATATLILEDRTFQVTFPDEMEEFTVVLSEPVPAQSLRFQIDTVYEGEEYDDTCIAELTLFGTF